MNSVFVHVILVWILWVYKCSILYAHREIIRVEQHDNEAGGQHDEEAEEITVETERAKI